VLLKRARYLLSAALSVLIAVAVYDAFVGFPVTHALPAKRMNAYGGHAYTVNVRSHRLWLLYFDSDSPDRPDASSARILENGARLGPAHSMHARIAEVGAGAYSHWGNAVYFSASDNSDPRSNGKTYVFAVTARLPIKMFARIAAISTGSLLLLWSHWLISLARSRLQNRQSGQLARAALLRISVSLGALIVAAFCFARLTTIAQGAIYWLLLHAIAVAAIFALRWATVLASCFFARIREWKGSATPALIVVSIGLACAGMELGLYLLRPGAGNVTAEPLELTASPPDMTAHPLVVRTGQAELTLPANLVARMEQRHRLITMPEAFRRIAVAIPGTQRADRWQGVLHIYDQNNLRRQIGPFPLKDPRVFRIIVDGDSLTYGDGIDAEWTYPAQLQRLLAKDYAIEVINLGADGLQSEDIARQIERMAPLLQPDLIIYGVCLNDFLPSGVRQYAKFDVPLPEWFKSTSLERTRLAGLLADGYNTLLLRLGLRADFYDDILSDFQGYQERFSTDVKRMNEFVRGKGLPPITGIVLDQFPSYGGRGYRIARTAEELMLKARFDVIPTEQYYREYDGHAFIVSHWEQHPDEQANAIFATMIADHLIGRPDLSRYKK
jgi:GDSL-like lipase/acylhydrolase family protein